MVALRGERRWLPSVEAVRLPAQEHPPAGITQGGVYLITGGFGGIGLALADHLARTVGAKLVLVGRTPLPDRAEWPRLLAAGAGERDAAAARKVRAVAALEALGTEVLAVAADVADGARMREVVALARERFGRLDGAFHAAGLPGAGLIQLKERDAAAAVLAPKVDGTLGLAAALSGLSGVPDCFLVLFSALTGITGGIGQVDYTAANAFLDAFAQHARQRGGAPVVAIDWCEWQWDDWADRLTALDPRLHDELQRQRRTYGLSFAEGMEALARILASGHSQVLVSTRRLQAVLTQQHSMAQLLESLGRTAPAAGGSHARPALATPYVAPQNEIEERLAGIWRELLGVQQVGVHDNFFQLGGHSLLGLQVMSRIQEAFHVDLPLRILFEASTVAELAAAVAASETVEVPEIRAASFDAQRVLENLDELSEEEMDEFLALMAEEEQLFEGGGS